VNETIVLTLSQHPLWGYIIQPVIAEIQKEGWLSIKEIAWIKSPVLSEMNEASKEIVRLSYNYSNKALMKSFSKEKDIADFYKKVTPETIENLIRPCIESNHLKIIQLLKASGLSFYIRKNIKVRTLHKLDEICISEETGKAIFHFVKDSDSGLKYFIRIKEGEYEDEVNIFGKTYYIICHDPAILIIDKQLMVFQDINAKKLVPFFEKNYIEIPTFREAVYLKTFVLNSMIKNTVETEGLDIREIKPEKLAMLKLENNVKDVPALILTFNYEGNILPIDHPMHKIVLVDESDNNVSLSWFYPDIDWETGKISILLENGLVQDELNHFTLRDYHNTGTINERMSFMMDWINEHAEALKHFEFSYPKNQEEHK